MAGVLAVLILILIGVVVSSSEQSRSEPVLTREQAASAREVVSVAPTEAQPQALVAATAMPMPPQQAVITVPTTEPVSPQQAPSVVPTAIPAPPQQADVAVPIAKQPVIPPNAVDAEQILNDYPVNETAANLKWKGKHVLVFLENIEEIREDGRVDKNVTYGNILNMEFVSIELDFAKDSDVIDLTPGDNVIATCRFQGMENIVVDRLQFRDCTREK